MSSLEVHFLFYDGYIDILYHILAFHYHLMNKSTGFYFISDIKIICLVDYVVENFSFSKSGSLIRLPRLIKYFTIGFN